MVLQHVQLHIDFVFLYSFHSPGIVQLLLSKFKVTIYFAQMHISYLSSLWVQNITTKFPTQFELSHEWNYQQLFTPAGVDSNLRIKIYHKNCKNIVKMAAGLWWPMAVWGGPKWPTLAASAALAQAQTSKPVSNGQQRY